MPQIILSLENPDDKIYLNENISCYLVADNLSADKIKETIATGKMVLSQGNNALEICQKYGLDGVFKEVDTSKPLKIQIKSLREALKKKTLGVLVPARRHEAMLAGEVEPEFIAFYEQDAARNEETIKWYNELFLIPLAWQAEDNSAKTKALDVDFLIVRAKNFENFGC